MNVKKHLHWLLYILFALSCARQTTPTGGPKDTIPPSFISSNPAKGQINFKGQEVELTFNEALLLNNPKEQIIITPDIQKKYDITVRKNKAHLEFENPLNDSTTYSINFRDAIQDITEKNPVVNMKIAFSTGTYIDSLSIEGKVTNPLEPKEVKNATVALYQSDTFDIFRHKPTYLTQTNDKGLFRIENLKHGTYFIYAIDDKNRNIIVDSKNEAYGFLADTIILHSNRSAVNIPLVKLDARPLKLMNARPYNTYFNIKLSKNLSAFTLTSESGEIMISSFAEDQSGIKVFNTIAPTDSVKVRMRGIDSVSNVVDTAFYVKFNKRDVKKEAFTMQPSAFKVLANRGTLTGQIKFNKPVLDVNYDSILYKIDSLNTIRLQPQDLRWDSLRNVATVYKVIDKSLVTTARENGHPAATQPGAKGPREKTKTFQLYLGKSAFVSIELDSSAQVSEPLKPLQFDETGIILVTVETKESSFIVQLLDKTSKVIQSHRNLKKVSFEDLTPDDYQLRLVIDRNNDGRWSPGNFYKRIEAEPTVFYYNEQRSPAIKLKANFEIGPLLITY